MSYLQDRKFKRKKFIKVSLFVLVFIFLIFLGARVFNGLSFLSHTVARPALTLGGSISEKFSNTASLLKSKKSFLEENESLKYQLSTLSARFSNYNSILDENIKLREILGRGEGQGAMVLSSILSKPGKSPYDTLIIDVGEKHGVSAGNLVLALGSLPIGRVKEVYSSSSKVVLFSSPSERTSGVVAGRDTFIEIVGRGGGNFEMILPREIGLEKGTEVALPGIDSQVLGIVETTISDPRDAYQKVLLVAPVNIQELKFVEVLI